MIANENVRMLRMVHTIYDHIIIVTFILFVLFIALGVPASRGAGALQRR